MTNQPAAHSDSRRATPNRLGSETSPYLQQHAFNPVDWFPWGAEALQKARSEQKPIFLSIGYSACHWCHVMEHESFEDPDIATVMNERFVNIKVDREERPDLDQIYMQAVQLLTGRGGWPMSVFLTPDLQPFYGGTYWPPTRRGGMPGFRDILLAIHDAWLNRLEEVRTSADRLTAAIQQNARGHSGEESLAQDLLRQAGRTLCRSADRRHGGFGQAPKFPHPLDLRVLLRCWFRFRDEEALQIARLTLDKMAAGGMYDQLGGGFHRYSTDEVWLVPHFEKMLYDNALLVPAYLEAWQITGDANYTRVVRETLDYVLREMQHPDGGFFSTQDADSEGVEGKFFVWDRAEILQLLGTEAGEIFCACYDVTGPGNWEHHNILNLPQTIAQSAQKLGIPVAELETQLSAGREKLLTARSQRIPPGRDDKILASWNGLMISALAKAAVALDEPRYRTAAEQGARFLLQSLQPTPGRLLHSYKDGQARFNAYLDDYAAVIEGLVELHQATQNTDWLTAALTLAETMCQQFADEDYGGFFYTSQDHETLIARVKDQQDNATPSGNSLAAMALLRLGRLTGRTDLEGRGVETLESLAALARQYPSAAGQTLLALDFWLGPTFEVAVIPGTATETSAGGAAFQIPSWQQALAATYLPHVLWITGGTSDATDSPLVALLAGKAALQQRMTAYVCERGACREPITTLENLQRQLGITAPLS